MISSLSLPSSPALPTFTASMRAWGEWQAANQLSKHRKLPSELCGEAEAGNSNGKREPALSAEEAYLFLQCQQSDGRAKNIDFHALPPGCLERRDPYGET
jgi:hypothetical protein